MANHLRQQSTTIYPLFFLMVDSTDSKSGKTGLSPTVTLSKNGGSFGAAAGAITEVGNGLYKVAGNATDSNTLGELWLHATGTGADPTDTIYTIVAFDPFATPANAADVTAIKALLPSALTSDGNIKADSLRISGTAQTGRDIGASVLISNGTGTGQVSLSSGAVLLQPTQAGVTIPTVTNLTNAPTAGDLTATMKASITAAATASTPTAAAVTAGVTLAASQHVIVDSGTVTTLSNMPAAPANWLDAAAVKSDAVTKIQSGLATSSQIPARFVNGTFASDGVFSTAALANAPSGGGGGGSDPWAVELSALDAYPAATAARLWTKLNIGAADDPIMVIPDAPAQSDLATVYIFTASTGGARRAGVSITLQLAASPNKANRVLEYDKITMITNADGFASAYAHRTDLISPDGREYVVNSKDLGISNAKISITTPTYDLSDLIA